MSSHFSGNEHWTPRWIPNGYGPDWVWKRAKYYLSAALFGAGLFFLYNGFRWAPQSDSLSDDLQILEKIKGVSLEKIGVLNPIYPEYSVLLALSFVAISFLLLPAWHKKSQIAFKIRDFLFVAASLQIIVLSYYFIQSPYASAKDAFYVGNFIITDLTNKFDHVSKQTIILVKILTEKPSDLTKRPLEQK